MTEMDELAAALSLEIAEAVMGNPTVEAVFSPDDLDGFKSDIQIEAVRVLNSHFARSRPSLSPAGVTEEQVDAALKAKPRNCTLAQWLDMTHISEAGARELVRAALEAAAKAQPRDYTDFDDWFHEQEGTSLRSERFNGDVEWLKAAFDAGRSAQLSISTGQGDEVDPAYTDGPFYYMPMPVNHDGHGPEMDAAKVAYVQHEVWNGYNLSLGTFPSEAIARWVANRLSISTGQGEAVYRCTGCGRLTNSPSSDLQVIKSRGGLSCCTKRNMVRMSSADILRLIAVVRAPSLPAGHVAVPVERLTTVLDEYDAQTKALPLGHEDRTRGASSYNWRRSVVDDIRAMLSALPHNQGEGK